MSSKSRRTHRPSDILVSVCRDSWGTGEHDHLSQISFWLCYGQLLFCFSHSICEPSQAMPPLDGCNSLWPSEDKYCLLVLAIIHLLSFFPVYLKFCKEGYCYISLTPWYGVYFLPILIFPCKKYALICIPCNSGMADIWKDRFQQWTKALRLSAKLTLGQQWDKVFLIKSSDRVMHFLAFLIQENKQTKKPAVIVLTRHDVVKSYKNLMA